MKSNIVTLLLMSLALTTVYGQGVAWLDGGNKILANVTDKNTSDEDNSTSKSNTPVARQSNLVYVSNTVETIKDEPFKVSLASGEEVVILGGVYVKTSDVQTVLVWAVENNYEAEEHDVIEGAIKVQTTPQQAIEVANLIAQLEGVTTSAPSLRRQDFLQ